MMAQIIAGVFALLGTVVTMLMPILILRGLAAFEKRTGIQLTDQQRAAVLGAAQTQAGIIETELHQGTLKLAQVSANNPAIIAHAEEAIARVPDSAASQGPGGAPLSAPAMAQIIVGKVNTAPLVAAGVSP